MKFLTHSQSAAFDLTAQGIDGCSAWLDDFMSELGTERKNRLRVCLLVEELLLRMREKLDETTTLQASIETRLRRPILRLEIKGASCNPMSESAELLGDWNSSLMTAIGMQPRYRYAAGRNLLQLALPFREMNPVLKIAVAMAIGILLGILGRLLLPNEWQQAVNDSVLSALIDLWVRALNAFSAPIIFLMVITTIINTVGITRQGGKAMHVIGRYFGFSLLVTEIAFLTAFLSFTSHMLRVEMNPEMLAKVNKFLLALVPENFLAPFLDSNTPQLFLLAAVLGAALLSIGGNAAGLSKGIRQLNMVGLTISKLISRLVPYVSGMFLCLEIWNSQFFVLLEIWKPLVLSTAISLVVMLCGMAMLSLRLKLKIQTVFQKMVGPFLRCLRAGSLDAAFDDIARSCTASLGIDGNYTKLCLPQGVVLYVPISAIGTLVFTMYIALFYNVTIDWLWQFTAVLLVVLLFVATPPVPGANLLAYAALFSWLDLPNEAIISAMIFDIVFGFFASAANLTMLQVETVHQAKHLGLLNMEVLRRPDKK